MDFLRRILTKACSPFLNIGRFLHNEFLGALTHYTKVARGEFLAMECCSFERRDLERHFDRMFRRFYTINGMNDVNIKRTFLNITRRCGIEQEIIYNTLTDIITFKRVVTYDRNFTKGGRKEFKNSKCAFA